jgi:hypothetical protein
VCSIFPLLGPSVSLRDNICISDFKLCYFEMPIILNLHSIVQIRRV